MRKRITLAAVAASLAACASERTAGDIQRDCRARKLTPGTQAFANCMNYGVLAELDRRRSNEQARMAIGGAMVAGGAGMQGYANGYRNAYVPPPPPQSYILPVRPTITCNTYGATTTCR